MPPSDPSLRVAERAMPARAGDGARTVSILDVPFTDVDLDGAVERIRDLLATDRPHQVVLANAHTLNFACEDAEYRAILQQAALVLRDGVGVELASLLVGHHLAANFVGTDFIPRLLARIGAQRVGVFLYGGRPGVAERAADVLARTSSGVRILGVEHGYAPADTLPERIGALAPDLVLVALGNPLQERWIARHLAQLNCRAAIGVGALFDYLGGQVRRAPRWVLALRSEWIFRLLVEPSRLGRRYLMGNPRFVRRVLAHHLLGARRAA